LVNSKVENGAHDAAPDSRDWLRSARTSALLWWVPQGIVVAALLLPVPARAAVWVAALGWMAMACILNARRCGRVHCRYTGPWYLVMIVPVLALAFGFVDGGISAWIALCVVMLGGSKVIWWATERAWGRFA
jgi:hypothetical protein